MNDLLTDDALAKMDEASRQFWTYWKDQRYYLQDALLANKERFAEFVDENEPTHLLIAYLAKEDPRNLLYDELFDINHFTNEEKRIIRIQLLEGLVDKNLTNEFFGVIHEHLSADLKEKAKQSRFLAQRGYSVDAIRQLLDRQGEF